MGLSLRPARNEYTQGRLNELNNQLLEMERREDVLDPATEAQYRDAVAEVRERYTNIEGEYNDQEEVDQDAFDEVADGIQAAIDDIQEQFGSDDES